MMTRPWLLCVVLVLPQINFAQSAPSRRQFIACPVVRDTKTVPCWLANYNGETYFLGIQSGVADEFYPPQLSHKALIEGTVGTGRVCGGIPLLQVKVSVLQPIETSCNSLLPAEDGIEAPERHRPTGPPPTWVKVNSADSAALYYDFDNDFHSLHMNGVLYKMAKRAADSPALKVQVTAYRGATLLSDGKTVTEKPGMAAIRAKKVAEMIRALGVKAEAISITAPEEALPADGVNDPWNRRVEITLSLR